MKRTLSGISAAAMVLATIAPMAMKSSEVAFLPRKGIYVNSPTSNRQTFAAVAGRRRRHG